MKSFPSRILIAALTTAALSLTAQAQYQYKETTLYTFGGQKDVYQPLRNLLADQQGNFYGASTYGGGGCSGKGCGTVWELSPKASGGWTETILYAFTGKDDGDSPIGSILMDAAGNVYGTTRYGGHNYGVVFELSPNSSGGWKETLLHDFTNGSDGADPSNSVTFDSANNLYGAADGTASNAPNTIFRLKPGTGGWVFSVIYTFPSASSGTDAQTPSLFDSAGNLYGVTLSAGRGQGSVYELTPPSKGATR